MSRPADKTQAKVLILGGTREARALADALAAGPGPQAELSLAGATLAPEPSASPSRSGGFGGADGLARHLLDGAFFAMIDATHPFATRISQNAVIGAARAQIPLLRLERPPWAPQSGDRWRRVADLTEAAATIPRRARVFLSVGPGGAAPFASRKDLWCAVRRIDPCAAPFPLAQGQWVIGKPSTSAQEERRLFERLRIDCLVTKNSGGSRAKLAAANALGLEVVMVERPPSDNAAPKAETVEQALDWLKGQLG